MNFIERLNKFATLLQSKGYKKEALLIAQLAPIGVEQESRRQIQEYWENNPKLSLQKVYEQWQREHAGVDLATQLEAKKFLQELEPHVKEILELSKVHEEETKGQEEEELKQAEQWLQRLTTDRRARDYESDFMEKFPKLPTLLKEKLQKFVGLPKPRPGETVPSWGKGAHIQQSLEILKEIDELGVPVRELPEDLKGIYVKGYVSIPFIDRGIRSVVLYNIEPMAGKRVVKDEKETVETSGRGGALYMIPYEIDGQQWDKFIRTRGREVGLRPLIKEKMKNNEPGWLWMPRGANQVQFLNRVLEYAKGE